MIKFVIVGDSCCGKTALLNRLVQDRFYSSCMPTIGIDYYSWKNAIPDSSETVQLWETSGQKRFQPILETYLRHSNVVVVVYDTRETLPTYWLDLALHAIDASSTMLALVGHQLEEGAPREIVASEDLEGGLGDVPHFTCNAKTGCGVKAAFKGILHEYLARHPLSITRPDDVASLASSKGWSSKSTWWLCCCD